MDFYRGGIDLSNNESKYESWKPVKQQVLTFLHDFNIELSMI